MSTRPNLTDTDEPKFLHTDIALKVIDAADMRVLEANMPIIRANILILLTSKKASDISTEERKKKLSEELVTSITKSIKKGQTVKIIGIEFKSRN